MSTDITRSTAARQPDDADNLYRPFIIFRKAVNISSTDQDLTATSATWPQAFARRLYVGGGGTVILKDLAGTSWTYAGVAAGTYIDGPMTAIVKIGTTATNMIAEQ